MISLRLALAPLLLAAGPLFAQGVLPGQSLNPGQPVQPQQNTGTAGNYSSSTLENSGDKLFDVKSDSIDLESGTMNWKGKTFNLGDTRMIRARFERYLAVPPPTQNFEDYIKILDAIDARISSINFSDSDANRTRNLQEAWNLLFEASKFEYDGNASITLANQVMKAWRERNELEALNISIDQQRQLVKTQEYMIDHRADILADKESGVHPTLSPAAKGGKNTPVPRIPAQSGESELNTLREKRLETKAGIVAGGAQAGLIGMQSKLEFQSTIVTFLAQRRFRHTLLANAFYRQIYRASHQQVQVGDKEMKELFPVSNFVPSLETLDSMAREAMSDVKTGLRTFEQLESTGDRFSAYERLQETYFLGEFEPEIIRLEYAKKRTYVELARDMRDLQKFGDERDLEAAEETLARVSASAKDFPAARIRSKIRTAKQASDMAVLAAKQAALINGKEGQDKVAEHLATAGKIWPLNPGIKNFMTDMTSRVDLVSQRMPEFDKLYDAGKYRELFERKNEFAIALLQDKPRLDKLNTVIDKVGKVEAITAQAEALSAQGNRYLAWDLIMEAERTDPADSKVAGLRSKLAPLVADYAKLLGEAARAEADGRPGPALAGYLAARDLNRGSKFCQDSLDRAARALLDATPAGLVK